MYNQKIHYLVLMYQWLKTLLFQTIKLLQKILELGLRGDGLRLWYSHDNIVFKNSLIKSRDMVVWYSHGNEISENYGEQNRYSLALYVCR